MALPLWLAGCLAIAGPPGPSGRLRACEGWLAACPPDWLAAWLAGSRFLYHLAAGCGDGRILRVSGCGKR